MEVHGTNLKRSVSVIHAGEVETIAATKLGSVPSPERIGYVCESSTTERLAANGVGVVLLLRVGLWQSC